MLQPNTQTGSMDTKRRPTCMMATRDSLQIQGQMQTESDGMDKGIPWELEWQESWNSNTHIRQDRL